VSGHQITELPLIGRAFTNLELVLPGVQASNDLSLAKIVICC
jgi:hypothetical protein